MKPSLCTLARAALLALGLAAAAPPAAAQEAGGVRGTVTDQATRRPLPGARVTVAGTPRGAVTDARGAYQLTGVPAGTRVLRVELLGYSPVERAVAVAAGQTITADFSLGESAISLDELVVVGYGTERRGELTAAVSSVEGAAIADQPVAGLDAALQGRVAGVQVVQNAGNPGNAPTVRVRGAASISASNQPLYVVDGVPLISEDYSQLGMGGQGISGVTGLSPEDIESIDVLKDAAATAIYGSRGSNGVIVVTTRRGRAGRPRATFSASAGTQEAARRLDLLSATEYLEFFNESAVNDGYDEDYYGVIGVDDRVSTDWQDEVLRTAPVQSYELGLSGGDERVRYYVGGTWFDQEGIVIGSSYERAGARANLDLAPTDRLSLAVSLGLARELTHRIENDGSDKGIITNSVGNAPLIAVRNDDGTFTGTADGLEYPNAVALGTLNDAQARTWRTLGNVEGRYRLLDALTWTSRVGFDVLGLRESQYESPRVGGTYAASSGGVAKSGTTTGARYAIDNFATWDQLLGDRHDVTLTLGSSVELNRGELNFIRGEQLGNDRLREVRNAAVIVDADATRFENNLVSFFSRAAYTFDDRLTLGGSVRYDGSSRFGENNRWGVFPAVSAAWSVANERFMEGVAFVDDLKVRASYGVTGNQAISNYPFQGLVGSANYGEIPGLAPSNLANPDLRWESTRQVDVGVDLLVLDERVGLTVDWYHKDTRDLLLDRPVTSTSGFTSVFDNVGEMENRGWEVSLRTLNLVPAREGGARWTTELNWTANRNRVTALFNDEPFSTGERDINRVQVGQPIGAFYTVKFLGVDPRTGDAIYEDLDDNGRIGSGDRQIVGSPHPDWTGGLANTLELAGFDLRAFVQVSQGAEVFNAMRLFSDAGGWYLDNQFGHVMERWRQPGDETDVPRASYDGLSGARTISSRFIEDGSYVRLQEVTLGYRLPAALARRAGMEGARVYVSGHNLHTWTDYMGYSPDVNSNGVSNAALGTDFYAYPVARTISLGIRGTW
ncbi:TonB-dependent receptor [Longimicrobium sp.]|uniref:SusC/RagA family TonB-linked outer membrane protein n=1 Tax=Longimicrobium sp. TaxID=2029185 RepID=UPI002E30F1D4|nr:TonB-dependent receptor [Longimicrobium sp.]HEX6040030.1 TonB-dependent receptor [Longimicrobium sp.]